MVAEGVMVRLPLVETGPTPLMFTPVALSVFHESSAEPPELIADGLTEKLRIVGGVPDTGGAVDPVTATMVDACTVPAPLYASRT